MRVHIALSGGQDSMVLLHMLHTAGVSIHAYHVNHQLSPHANAWAETVQQHCASLQIPYTCLVLNGQPQKGESVEAWAREARYTALIDALPNDSVLVTAHHQSDQAETVLLQLLRGAGPKGLSGIAAKKRVGGDKNITLYRPLLTTSKQEIETYAREHQLTWIEDESNQQLRFDRNFIRHHALPLLQSREPAAIDTIARAASHLQEQQAVLSMLLDQNMPAYQGSVAGTLSVKALLNAPAPAHCSAEVMMKAVLRHWLSSHHVAMPSQKMLGSIINDVLSATSDAMPRVCWDNWVVTRYRDDVYVLPQEAMISLSGFECVWDPREALILPHGAGTLCLEDLVKQGIVVKAGDTVLVRFRSLGETIWVEGVGHQSFKKWCQSRGIPPWERGRVAVICIR